MAVIVPIVSKFDDKGLKQAQGEFGKLGKSLKGALGAAAIGAAVIGVTKVLGDAAKAAATDAKSQALLATQLRTTASASDAQISAVEQQISKMSMLAGVADDEIRPAFAQLVRATGDVGQAQSLTNTALDIAAAKGVSVTAAATALGKAAQGNTGALAKMGIAVKGVSDPLAEAQKQFAGAAAAAGNANPFQRLTVIFDELKESLGRAVLPLIQSFADLMMKNAPAIDAFFGKLGEVFQSLMPLVGPLFEIVAKLASMIGDVLLAVMPSLIKVFEALLPVIDPVLKVIQTLVDAVLPPLIQLIDSVLVPILELLVGYINDFLLPYIDDLSKAFGEVLTEAVIAVIEIFDLLKSAFEPIMQAFKDLQKDTGIDFMAIFKSLSPAMIALQALARSLAVITFSIKMARAAAMGDWAAVAKLTAEGPYAAMQQRAQDAAVQRGQDAAGARLQAQADAWKAAQDKKNPPPKVYGVVPPPVVQQLGADKAAKAAADKAEKARLKALADAAQKLADEAKQAYLDLKATIDDFNKSLADTAKGFRAVFAITTPMGEFEQQTVDAFDTIKQAAQDAFDNKLITKVSLDTLNAYADHEKVVLWGIARERDQLAKKISIAQAITGNIMGSLNINNLLNSETQTVTKSVTSFVGGVATTVVQTFEEVVNGGIVDNFKKLVEKTKTFASNLSKLKTLGLNGNLFKQIVDAGAEAGNATAESIIAGGASAVTELNGLFKDLTDAGSTIAETATPVLYGLGEDITNSFIEGLRSKDKDLAYAANSMASIFATNFQSSLNTFMLPALNVSANAGGFGMDNTDFIRGYGRVNSYGTNPNGGNVTVNVNAGVISDKATLPQIIVDALGTYTKQSGAGGLTRVLGL